MRNPHRHCECAELLMEALMRQLVRTEVDRDTQLALNTLADTVKHNSVAGCLGTEIPNVNWHAVREAVEKVMQKEAAKLLEDHPYRRKVGKQDFFVDGEDLYFHLESTSFYNKLSLKVTASVEKLWKILTAGSAKPHETIKLN